MADVRGNPPEDLRRFAQEKMTAVLGVDRARALLQQLVDEKGMPLDTPQDLYAFSEALCAMKGFEGAVGAMLGVAAVMRGARIER